MIADTYRRFTVVASLYFSSFRTKFQSEELIEASIKERHTAHTDGSPSGSHTASGIAVVQPSVACKTHCSTDTMFGSDSNDTVDMATAATTATTSSAMLFSAVNLPNYIGGAL